MKALSFAILAFLLSASAMEPVQLSHPVTAEENEKNMAERNAKASQDQAALDRIWAIQDHMTNVAKRCPGVGSANAVMDASHIGVLITPGTYVTSSDLTDAVTVLIIAYSTVLNATPDYQGYLRIGIVNLRPDGHNYVTQVFEATALETRTSINRMDILIGNVLARAKSVGYTRLVDGYEEHWP
jgi:hypothetical protein